ncbi:uncharacterized protein DS421_9g275720 [Arachis hypogaea]|nr:uncharacterized protein DS421_9g275720 [Arachis hypogaea]
MTIIGSRGVTSVSHGRGRGGFHRYPNDFSVITLYPNYPVDPCDVTGGSHRPAVYHGPKSQLRSSFYHAPSTPIAPMIKPVVVDSSNASQLDAPPPTPVIWMRIWPDGIQA